MTILEGYKNEFLEKYNNFPQGKYVNILIVRKTGSEAIFRTEGNGEPLVREYVRAGKEKTDIVARSVISKRKQTAVERRTGREGLRKHQLLGKDVKGKFFDCTLNTNSPCEKCPDCMIYGFAVGGAGAQKARVITEDAFSILPINYVLDTRTFNATYDNGTMRNPITGEASTSLGSSEYIKPETHYIDIQVLKDVTEKDFIYVLGNILRSTRYGAMSSKIGRVKNTIAKIVFSDTEIFSTLELTQAIYDDLSKNNNELDFPLKDDDILKSLESCSEIMLKEELIGQYKSLSQDEMSKLKDEIKSVYQEPESFLKDLYRSYQEV